MSTTNRVHNAGPHELVFTQDGRILEGFTTANADLEDRVTSRLVGSGQLVVIQVPPAPEAKKTTRRSASKTTMIDTPPSGDNLEGA